MASRMLVLMKKVDDADAAPSEQAPALGTIDEVVELLRDFNTGPENPEEKSPEFLYGPGITIQVPPTEGPITQLLVTLVEEEIAWSVVARICKHAHWKMVDPESGRSFG